MGIVTLKLMNGEEIIGDVYAEDDTVITLRKIRLMVLMQGPGPGDLVLQLMPWLYGADQDGIFPPIEKAKVFIHNKHVPKQLESRYISETSPIQLVR